MKKTSSIPLIFIFIAFAYSLTHLFSINQMTALTFLDVTQLFYAIFFWIFLFGVSRNYGFFEWIGSFFYPMLHPILKLTKTEIAIYLSSIFSGYPTYAKIIKDAHLPNERSRHLLKFCSHPSIGFVVSTLGLTLFQDIKIGYYLFIVQVISNFLIALIFRSDLSENQECLSFESLPLIPLLKQQFKGTFEIFIYIFGFMLVFRIIYLMIPFDNVLILGILEFSQGCLALKSFPNPQAFILSSFFLSFSSLSVICQSISILGDYIDLKGLLFDRLIQALLSSLVAFIFTFFIF